MRALTTALLAAAALLAVAAPWHAAATFDVSLECVDADKRANFDKAVTAHGGPKTNKMAICKVFKKGLGVFKGHTSIVHTHGDTAAMKTPCYDIDPVAHRETFNKAGCAMFSAVVAKQRAAKQEITSWLQGLSSSGPTESAVGVWQLCESKKIALTGEDELMKALNKKQKEAWTKCESQDGVTKTTWTQMLTDAKKLELFKKFVKVHSDYALQGLATAAQNSDDYTEEVTDFAKGSATKRFAYIAAEVGKPYRRYKLDLGAATTPAEVALHYLLEKINGNYFQMLFNKITKGTFYSDHVGDAAAKKALQCTIVSLGQAGYNLGRVHNDVALGCAHTSKKFTMRPACSRLGIWQLHNWNRDADYDAKAPWSLYGGYGDVKSRHTAIKMNAANYLKKAYQKDEVYNKCVSKVRVHGKTGPKVVICQAFTECMHNVQWHVAQKYPGCKADVEDSSVDDKIEVTGVQDIELDTPDDKGEKPPEGGDDVVKGGDDVKGGVDKGGLVGQDDF